MTDDELKRLLAANAAETRDYFEQTRHHFDEVAERIVAESRQLLGETRGFFETTAESLRHEIQIVAEGVVATREALDQRTVELRDEIRRSAAETQSMLKFSHSDLDRRVQSLEEAKSKHDDAIAQLEARVERIESTTH